MLKERIPLGIICAMPEEIAALLGDMVAIERRELAGREVLIGQLFGRPVAMIESGIGKVASAMTATLLLDGLRCRAIVMSGVAGGIDPALAIGDLVVAQRLIQHDYGRLQADGFTPFRPAVPPFGPGRKDYAFDVQENLVARIHTALDGFQLPRLPVELVGEGARAPMIKIGTIVSGDQFINGRAADLRRAPDQPADRPSVRKERELSQPFPPLDDLDFGVVAVEGLRRLDAPDRARPGRIIREAADHMDMKLRHHIAERRHVQLFRLQGFLDRPAGLADLGQQQGLVGAREIDDVARPHPARHQDQPGIGPVVHPEHPAERPIHQEQTVIVQPRIELEIIRRHSFPALVAMVPMQGAGTGDRTARVADDRPVPP
jgi:nucleoside phosphorylase